MKSVKEVRKIWMQIINRALSDPSFKKKLIQNPNFAFQEYGVKVDHQLMVVEDSPTVAHYILYPNNMDKSFEALSFGHSNPWHDLRKKVMSDEVLKKQLMTNPEKFLRDHGIKIRKGAHCKIVEASKNVQYLILPPQGHEVLSDEDLSAISAGDLYG